MQHASPESPPPGDAGEASGGTGRAAAWARTWGPWGLAAAILAYLFSGVPLTEIWASLRGARLDLFLPAVLGAVTGWFWLESGAFAYLFSRFNAPLSWREARSLRGMTYLLTPINWNAGTAGIILHLRRSKSIGALESSSSMLLYGAVDALVLGSLLLLGTSQLAASAEVDSLRRIGAGVVGAQLAGLALFLAPMPEWRWLERVRDVTLFRSFRMATLRDLAILISIRGLYFAAFVGLFWGGAHAFGVRVPLAVSVATMPPIMLAAALPITPAGLGTQQAAMLFFYRPYGPETAILAFGLCFPVAITVARCALGLRYLRGLERLRW